MAVLSPHAPDLFAATRTEMHSVANCHPNVSAMMGGAAAAGDPAPLDLADADVHRVVYMRGLPFEATKSEVLEFFEDFALSASDVHLVRRADDGKPSGEGFAVFPSVEAAQQALSKDRETIGERWIELRLTNKIELSRRVGPAVAAVSREDSHFAGVLRMRGLPWSATAQDIITFFAGFMIQPRDGVYLTNTPDGRPSGEAYVVFSSEAEAERALELDKAKIGGRWIDLIKCCKADLYAAQAFAPSLHHMGYHPRAGMGMVMVNCVRMRGLPYRADEASVFEFFAGLRVIGIFLVRDWHGRASGEGFAEFATCEECQTALLRNRATLYDRYVELFPASKDEVVSTIHRLTGMMRPPGGGPLQQYGGYMIPHPHAAHIRHPVLHHHAPRGRG